MLQVHTYPTANIHLRHRQTQSWSHTHTHTISSAKQLLLLGLLAVRYNKPLVRRMNWSLIQGSNLEAANYFMEIPGLGWSRILLKALRMVWCVIHMSFYISYLNCQLHISSGQEIVGERPSKPCYLILFLQVQLNQVHNLKGMPAPLI